MTEGSTVHPYGGGKLETVMSWGVKNRVFIRCPIETVVCNRDEQIQIKTISKAPGGVESMAHSTQERTKDNF